MSPTRRYLATEHCTVLVEVEGVEQTIALLEGDYVEVEPPAILYENPALREVPIPTEAELEAQRREAHFRAGHARPAFPTNW